MKKIIEGKLYNTSMAKVLHEWQNMANVTDFKRYKESLYVTKNGSFFLHGEGGPGSKYSVKLDSNSWGAGEAITPLSQKEAARWLEDHGGDDILLDEFAEFVTEA